LAWLSGWDNRIKLTIDKDVVDTANQTNFPVMVSLSAASGIGDVDVSCVFDELTADANRKKIAVTSDDGTTELYVEIERWDDANEKAWLHVKVPTVAYDADTELYLYYDADHADNDTYVGDIDSIPGAAVWDSNFKAVWHMRDATTSTVKDSTGNNHDGTKVGANEPNEVDGKVDKAQEFSGDDQGDSNITVTDHADFDLQGDFTIEALAYCDAFGNAEDNNNYVCRIVNKDDNPGGRSWQYNIRGEADGVNVGKQQFIYDVPASTLVYSSTAISLTTWTSLAMVFDNTAGSYTFYKDGSADGTASTDITPNNNGGNVTIGGGEAPSVWVHDWDGKLDEVRISETERSAPWIKATYHSLWDSLITFGAEELNLDIDVSATTATLTVTPNAATVIGATGVYPNTIALTITPNAATVAFGIPVAATCASLTVTANAADAVFTIPIIATSASLTITPNAATVRVGTVAVFYPAVNGDDGYWNDTTGFFSTGDAIYLCNSTSFPRSCFIRFPNITIPNYATIISTHVTLTSFGYGDNETANANVYFNDSANAVAPTDLTTANALSLTNNVAAWNALPAWVDGTQYDTPSLVDELQEVIENPSWSHDNAVMLIIKDNSSTNDASRPASTVDFDGGSEKAELHVEYSLPDLNVEAITATLTATPKNATINIAAATATLTITPNTADAVFNIPINAALASLSITPNAVTLNTVVVTSVAPLTITPNAATRSWDLEVSATLNELTIATYDAIVFDGAEWAAWIAANESRASKYYYFILTGAADSLEDVTIPISSFQARRNYTSPTYLSVIIKDLTYADAISARSNGDMQIKMEYEVNGVVEQSSIMIEVDLEDISVNEGASNASIGLVGHRIEGYAPKSILLENIVYGTLKDGKYQYRCSIPNLYLSPGDTVTADGNEFTVDKISYIVSPKSQMMYVKEA